MLKLVKLYSNKPDIFPEIKFHDGLNVIYASVTKEVSDKRSSHSLGKTLLADLIDYMLVKDVGTTFFLKEKKIFEELEFFLEIQTETNLFITIKRPSVGKVSIFTSQAETNILSGLDFSLVGKNLGVESARNELDKLLRLAIVKNSLGYFRKGLRYCIRRQEEFLNIFKAKNVAEKDRDWKPYLCGLLGINPDLVAGKYNTKETTNRLTTAIKELELIGSSQQNATALEAEITRLRKSSDEMVKELNAFSFQKIDKEITKELVEDVGFKIAQINQDIFSTEQKLADIDESLNTNFDYDTSQIRELFESITVHLPELLVKKFDDLVELNKKMTHGRKEHLENAKEKLLSRYTELNLSRTELNLRQQNLSGLLIEKEAFKKYQLLNSKLNQEESKIAVLQERLQKMDSAAELRTRLSSSIRQEEELTNQLLINARQSNNGVLRNINAIFGELIKDILGIDAYFYMSINKEGNPHFQTGISDNTSVDKGHSFNKVMAACFDVALLTHYSSSQYYRFSYHDGLLESLDDRVKLRLIDSWRILAERNNLQLIITVLDTDVPENELGSKVYFKEKEIIRELNDKGNSGRLFRTNKF
jgi:uncharacterized protein YydD (DUF2326 family)